MIIHEISELRKCVYAIAEIFLQFPWGDKMSVKDAVAERFRELCKQREIKTNELATRSGVTPSTVYSLLDERRRDVSIITIKKLCDGLDVTLEEFFAAPEFAALSQEIE